MRAFITGITGQDGFYLSRYLISQGYSVYGLVRRTSQERNIPDGVQVVNGDVTDPGIISLIEDIKPSEIYNLAAMSFVWESFKVPKTTFDINALGTLHTLEAARKIGCKIYQASTSELYGASPPPQNEKTPFYPRSPYGVSKLAAYWLTVNYRESYGIHASNGILFNHESPMRGMEFVTRKVCNGVARIYYGLSQYIVLGNLDAKRDWGHAKDFVRAMHLVTQQDHPDDYVVATGESRSIKDLLTEAFLSVGIHDWSSYVKQDLNYYRPADVDSLIGDSSKIRRLGWKPEYTFERMIAEMMEKELERVKKEHS